MDAELEAALEDIGTRLDDVKATAARAEQAANRAERGVVRCNQSIGKLATVVARTAEEGRRNAQMVGTLAEAVGTMRRHFHERMADVLAALERTERIIGEYGQRLTRIIQIVMEGRTTDSDRMTQLEARLGALEAEHDPA